VNWQAHNLYNAYLQLLVHINNHYSVQYHSFCCLQMAEGSVQDKSEASYSEVSAGAWANTSKVPSLWNYLPAGRLAMLQCSSTLCQVRAATSVLFYDCSQNSSSSAWCLRVFAQYHPWQTWVPDIGHLLVLQLAARFQPRHCAHHDPTVCMSRQAFVHWHILLPVAFVLESKQTSGRHNTLSVYVHMQYT